MKVTVRAVLLLEYVREGVPEGVDLEQLAAAEAHDLTEQPENFAELLAAGAVEVHSVETEVCHDGGTE
jgi:hypothetical protein